MEELFLTRISLKEDIAPQLFDNFPLNIAALRMFVSIKITNPVTIFQGENGCGKSTLIEALADQLGMPTSGGNKNMEAFVQTNLLKGNETAPLSEYLLVAKSYRRPSNMYFFRAESFHEISTLIDEDSKRCGDNKYLNSDNYRSKDLLGQSHGESFIDLIEHQFVGNGLYILDEPESALSPSNQLRLLKIIHKLTKDGSQFIIATHSPILLGYKDAAIVNLDYGMRFIDYKDTKLYKLYKSFMDDNIKFQEELFSDD